MHSHSKHLLSIACALSAFGAVASATHLRFSREASSFYDAMEVVPTTVEDRSIGRLLQDGTCDCSNVTAEEKPETIRMYVRGEEYYKTRIAGRFSSRAQAFYDLTGIKVEVVRGPPEVDWGTELVSLAGTAVYDGFFFYPVITGQLVEAGALADVSSYVGGELFDWKDVLPFMREQEAVFDGKVRLIPCESEMHALYYRKDLFKEHNIEVPRTWDEYTEIAKYFHGMEVPAADGNGTVTLVGSCVDRGFHAWLRNLLMTSVHTPTVVSKGTNQGIMFDASSFTPGLGEAFAETLRHLENQARYGAEEELDIYRRSHESTNFRYFLREGRCALTYYWGDMFVEQFSDWSKVSGKVGVARMPGVTKVYDHEKGKLVQCTVETCPHGVDYRDIGRVNYAPFVTGGGMSAVASNLPKEREAAMANFLGFVCGTQESMKDVVVFPSDGVSAFSKPYRRSHLNVDPWVEQGFPRATTEEYLQAISDTLGNPNAAKDERTPGAYWLKNLAGERSVNHLVRSKFENITHEDRLQLAAGIEKSWMEWIADYDANRPPNSSSLKELYQKDNNVYFPPKEAKSLAGGAIAGLVVGCSVAVGLAIGVIVWFLGNKKFQEQKRIAEELTARQKEMDDTSSEIVEVEERNEVEEILKLTESTTKIIALWEWILTTLFVGFVVSAVVIGHLSLDGKSLEISAGAYTAMEIVFSLLVSGCFYMYKRAVRRRTELITSNSAQANAIVTSMFPGQFREQMIEHHEQEQAKASWQTTGSRMKNFMAGATDTAAESKPLADLYLETTVMFADIVGFTSWSSARSPVQVFTLLESSFSKFDELSSRRGVSKVETVGDCYVAVSGLPDPRPEHCAMMGRFARDIIRAMSVLMKELEVSLGPDTAELTLRIGMNSGPVTAGVLRGARARFQLFGDTVNTCSRIEASGSPNKIHVSESCAEELRRTGHSFWLESRQDPVSVRGKGLIKTYWLKPRSGGGSSTHKSDLICGMSSSSESSGMVETDVAVFRQQRLIDWNVEQFLKILKQVVARREGTKKVSKGEMALASAYEPIPEGTYVLDEVKEICELPEYDGKAVAAQPDPERDVHISSQVVEEMRHLVASICATYNDNHFHNFEHASAVTMSVLKLLARIVAPTDFRVADNPSSDDNAALHDHTYGITSDPLTQFACAFSALIHDSDHYGVPNAQLVKEQVPISTLYQNRSVAEQNSLVLCWNLLMRDEYSEFRKTLCATQSELDRFRSLVVNSVLATDIFDKDLKALRNNRWQKAFSEITSEDPRDSTNRKATIVIEHLIQASDVCHTMQHWKIYRKWNERFFRECYSAYKAGRADKNPADNWYQGELGFFDFYIIPIAKKLKDCGVFGKSSDEFLNYAVQNRAEWESRGQEVVSQMLETIQEEEMKAIYDIEEE